MKRVVFTLRKKNINRGLPSLEIPDLDEFKLFIRRRGGALFFLSTLFIGLVAGSVAVNSFSKSTLNALDFLFTTNLPEKLKSGISGAFFASFASDFIFLGAAVFFSLSLMGAVFLPAVTFFKGFSIGVSAAYLVANYGIKGALFYFCIILPGVFVFALILVHELSAGVSIYKKIFQNLFKERNYNIKGALSMFMKKSLKNLLFTLIVSAGDAVIWFLFAGLFK